MARRIAADRALGVDPRRVLGVLCVAVRPGAARAAVADYLGKPIGSVRLVIEGRETTEPLLTQIVVDRAGAAAVDGAGARDRRAPVQPRPVRGRQRRRDARGRAGRAALRAHPDSSGRADPLRRAAGRAGHRRGRAAPRHRRSLRRVAAARPRRGHDADPRRRAARARLPATRRSRRGRCSSTRPSARRWCSRSTRARARRSATVEIVGAPTVSRAEFARAPRRCAAARRTSARR